MNTPNVDLRASGTTPRSTTPEAHARAVVPPICAALGLDAQAAPALDALAVLTDPGAEARKPGASPSTFVLGFGERDPELRLVVESEGDAASRSATRRLTERYALSGAAVGRIEDLFYPSEAKPSDGTPVRHAHAATFGGKGAARFEVLFDARAQGRWHARGVVEEALARLGLGQAWSDIAERVLRRGFYLDEIAYLAVSLPASADARGSETPQVELYVRHHHARAADIVGALGSSPLAAQAEELCVALSGPAAGYGARPLLTRHTIGAGARATATALYVPVAAHARNDAVVRGRVSAQLANLGLAADSYERALDGFAGRPLTAGPSVHEYVGLRNEPSGLVLSVELSSDPHGASAIDLAPEPPRVGAEDIVRRFEHEILLADHPFLRRLAREPVRLGPLWLMIANFWEGIVHDFPARVARVIASVDDDRVRCVLANQLNDELGEGNYDRAHKPMFRTLLDALGPHRMEGSDDVLLAPGRAFGDELAAMMFSKDPYEAIGAMMMVEIHGKQVDLFMGSQFRRQDVLDPAALFWLHLHEGLEVEHAEESFILARCIPNEPEAIASAWRGAEAIVTAGRHYFDSFYRVCFG